MLIARVSGALLGLSAAFRSTFVGTQIVARHPPTHLLALAEIIRQAGYDYRAVERIIV
jgi:hypothetical protein